MGLVQGSLHYTPEHCLGGFPLLKGEKRNMLQMVAKSFILVDNAMLQMVAKSFILVDKAMLQMGKIIYFGEKKATCFTWLQHGIF